MTDFQDMTFFEGMSTVSARSKLAELRDGKWFFIDPNSLNWDIYDRFTDFHQARETLGILNESATDPTMIVERVNPGEKLLRDVTSTPNTFWKEVLL